MLDLLSDQEAKARATLSTDVFDYYASGSADEITRDQASEAWSSFRLRPHPLRDVSNVQTSLQLFGSELATPIAVAPTAFHKLGHSEGERASIVGASRAGGLFVLSTRASLPIAEIGAATTAPWWFQVYVMRDRDVTARIVLDAVEAGAKALVLTGDTPVVGRKRRVQGVRHPLPDDHFLVNISRHLTAGQDGRAAAAQDPAIGLGTIEWLHRLTGLPVLVKGVLRGDAAVECVDAGAAGVIVSNHGGRQLDRSIPSAFALKEITTSVGDRVPVMVDGGIRSGLDVLVALALGARAVFVGRPILWALAADGADGVRSVLAELTDDLRHVMTLAGLPNLAAIQSDLVVKV